MPKSWRGFGGRTAFYLLTTFAVFSGTHAFAQPAGTETGVDDVVEVRERFQEQAIETQERIAALDDETVTLLSEYNNELAQLDDLETYNGNLRDLLASQARERSQLESELREIEVVRRELVPLMKEMVEVLGRFIDLDIPILEQERRARLEALQRNLTRSDIDMAEKYRRLIEAYQIEAEYGQAIEAYEGTLVRNGRELTVDFMHVGRIALYYILLDRSEAGIWDPQGNDWVTLPSSSLDDLDYALRVARKQAPPDLMPLPLWTPDR
jgi:vacuolar-type H+-ATPase subunit I/STV1